MGKTLLAENLVFTELQYGIEQARATLGVASWCVCWEQAEPSLLAVRGRLAGVVATALTGDLPDMASEILWTGAYEALQLVLRTIDTAIQFVDRGQSPTFAVRRLIGEAITTLDDALNAARES